MNEHVNDYQEPVAEVLAVAEQPTEPTAVYFQDGSDYPVDPLDKSVDPLDGKTYDGTEVTETHFV